MTFLDKNGGEIGFYDPDDHLRDGLIREIGDDEELIGVYGVRNKKHYFTSFGFIVKVRQD